MNLLLDSSNWQDNPFAARDMRRDAKRGQPAKTYGWMLSLMLASATGAAALISLLWEHEMGIPWFAGASIGTALCVAVCGIHAIFVQGASQALSQSRIQQEQQRHTLQAVLLLPTPPLQMVAQQCVYPWLAAMRLALAGLPFYALSVAVGGLSWADVLLLYVVFAGLSVTVPNCRAPALADAAATPGATQSGTGTTTASANQSSSGGAAAMVWMSLGVIAVLLLALMSGRSIPATYAHLHHYIPARVLDLLPAVFLSWPLVLARALVTPFDWYSLPLPPGLFAVPLFLLGRYAQALRSSQYLQVSTYRDLAFLETFLPRIRLQGCLTLAWIFIGLGYLWRWAVRDQALALLVPITGPADGLGGFLFLALVVTGWRVMARAATIGGLLASPSSGRTRVRRLVVRQTTLPAAIRFVAEPFCSLACFCLAACLLSRTNGFDPQVLALAGQLVAVILAGATLSFALLRIRVPLILFAPVLVLVVLQGPPELRPLAALSPTLGMLARADPRIFLSLPLGGSPLYQLFRHAPLWWTWPVVCGSVGAIVLLWSSSRGHASESSPFHPFTPSPPQVLDPTLYGSEPFMDGLLPTPEQAAAARKEHPPLAQRIIHAVERMGDNAIAVREVRTRLRGRLGPTEFRWRLMFFAVATVALIALPGITQRYGFLAVPLFGFRRGASPPEAYLLGCFYLAMLWMALGAGLGIMPFIFAPERERSTLGFLLTTPMRSRDIVGGKLLGLLLPQALPLVFLSLWTLGLTLMGLPALGGAGIRAWVEAVTAAFGLMLSSASGSVAMAALFPRRLSQLGCGVVLYLVIYQLPIQAVSMTLRTAWRGRRPRRLAAGAGRLALPVITAPALWLWLLTVCLLFTVVCLGLATWSIRRMRRRDIDFGAAKVEN